MASHSYTLLPYTFAHFNVHVHRAHFSLDYIFYTKFANEFLVKFDLLYKLPLVLFVPILPRGRW